MQLSPFELECVSINEREHSNFYHQIYRQQKAEYTGLLLFLETLMQLAIFTHNNYSF